MTSDQVRLRRGVIEWRELEGEIVALDLDAWEYFTVNPTGTAIWPLLAEGASRDELVDRLEAAYGVPAESAAADVDRFLAVLAKRDLLETP